MPESEKYEGLIGLKNLSQRIRKKTSGFSCPRIIISTHTKPTTTSPPMNTYNFLWCSCSAFLWAKKDTTAQTTRTKPTWLDPKIAPNKTKTLPWEPRFPSFLGVISYSLTWNTTMEVWKMIFLFNWVIFRFQPLIFRAYNPHVFRAYNPHIFRA